jgi:hypothetical protein
MNFEVQNALTTLDSRTAAFFIEEFFAHGDLTAKRSALVALVELDQPSATRQLIAMLKLY